MEKLFNKFFQIKFIKIGVEKSCCIIYFQVFILFKINFSFKKSTKNKTYILLIVILDFNNY